MNSSIHATPIATIALPRRSRQYQMSCRDKSCITALALVLLRTCCSPEQQM